MPAPTTNGVAVGGRPTIRDVAAEAAVSTKTVSRVLNGEPSVRPATARNVRDAIARLGFERNEAAANLRRRRKSTSLVGLVVGDLGSPGTAVLARGAEQVGREHGYYLLVASSGSDAAIEAELIRTFRAGRVDGLIVVPTGSDLSFLAESTAGAPVVFADRLPGNLRADSVVAADADGARQAVEYLLARHHRRIGFLGGPASLFSVAQRYRGYEQALAAAAVDLDPALVRLGLDDTAGALDAAAALLRLPDPATALFGADTGATIGALRAAAGRSDVAVIGFDDFQMAGLLDPPVTVVARDVEALGRTAAELLLRRIGGDRRPVQRITLDTVLIPRASGEKTAGRSPATPDQ